MFMGPYKCVPVALRDHLWELKGARLPVWLAHYLHSNREGISWPGLELLEKETGLDRKAIFRARRWLRERGWLEPVDGKQRRGARSRFESRRFRVWLPDFTAFPKSPHGQNVRTDEKYTDRVPKKSSNGGPKKSIRSRTKEGTKTKEAFTAWDVVLQKIKPGMNPQTYATWFQRTEGYRFVGENGDRRLQVMAPSRVAQKWLETDGRQCFEAAAPCPVEFVSQ